MAALVLDAGGIVTDCNHVAARLLDRSAADLLGSRIGDRLDRQLLATDSDPGRATAVQLQLADGHLVDMLAQVGPLDRVAGDGTTLVLLTPSTATTNRRGERVPLTRSWTDIARRCASYEGDLLCVAIGLIGMRAVDAVFGRSTGDSVMAQVHEKLRIACDARTIVERIDSGQFVVITAATPDDRLTVSRLVWAACEPLASPLGEVVVGCAAGVTVGDARSPLVLLEGAHANLHTAIHRGAGAIEWSDERCRQAADPAVRSPIDVAKVARDGATVRFQPVVRLTTGDVVEYEAVARWGATGASTLTTAQRLLLARSDGGGSELDAAVLAPALDLIAQLHSEDPTTTVRISVNISARELSAASFASKFLDDLARRGVLPSSVQLELSDRFDRSQRAGIRRAIGALREQGVRLALDDFGNDAADLCTLGYADFDAIKLAPKLIDADRGAHGDNLLRSVVQLADRVGVDTVAKGVESLAQHGQLIRAGCMYGQGPLYGHPLPHHLGKAATVAAMPRGVGAATV